MLHMAPDSDPAILPKQAEAAGWLVSWCHFWDRRKEDSNQDHSDVLFPLGPPAMLLD